MFEVFPGADGQWYFRFKGANNEKVVASEGYGSQRDAERGVQQFAQAFLQMLAADAREFVPIHVVKTKEE